MHSFQKTWTHFHIAVPPSSFSEDSHEPSLFATDKEGVAQEHSTEYLRIELIEMLRISQRAVDYAAKAYESGRPEYALHASSGRARLNYLSHRIFIQTSELRETQQLDNRKFAFESVCTIAAALFFTGHHAFDWSLRAVELPTRAIYKPLEDLVLMGARANSTMRLCAVAIVSRKIEHAEQALRDIDDWRHDADQSSWPRGSSLSLMLPDAVRERSIARSLLRIMDNMRTMALTASVMFASQT